MAAFLSRPSPIQVGLTHGAVKIFAELKPAKSSASFGTRGTLVRRSRLTGMATFSSSKVTVLSVLDSAVYVAFVENNS